MKTIGFVPTMGYLHEGHLSLIRQAKKENDICVVSVYVNPTQFGQKEDYDSYPRNIERDKRLAKLAGADNIFCPTDEQIYSNGKKVIDYTNKYMRGLCANNRSEHFSGVVTVVKKLFDIINPTSVYFGQKDYQQCLVIKQMIKDFKLPVKFIMCPTIRESDGLAMSSRNKYLISQQRKQAASIFQSLELAKELIKQGKSKSEIMQEVKNKLINDKITKIDYIEFWHGAIALAVYIGKTRLIDNYVIKK